MSRNNKKRKPVPVPDVAQAPSILIPNQPKNPLREDVSANQLVPQLSFFQFDESRECISDWTAEECKQLFSKLRQLCGVTWQSILSGSGKGPNKQGFGFTEVGDPRTLKRPWPDKLSEDCVMSEIRISQKMRVFGVRSGRTYFVVWLDRNHEVWPGSKK